MPSSIPGILCTVHAYGSISGNCVRLMLAEMEPLHVGTSASHFCNGKKWSEDIAFLPTKGS